MKTHFAAISMLALGACGGTGDGPDPGSTAPTLPEIPHNMSFPDMLNYVRAESGVGAVIYDSRLEQAAQAHANDMLAKGYLEHEAPDGSTPGDRITATGYIWQTYGENIAQGYDSERDVLVGWTHSPDHHANDIHPGFEDFGLAQAGSGADRYWVLVLAAEFPTPP
jgi:uncharacterized protein YkwD